MNQGHLGYLSLLDEMRSLHVKKAADYGVGSDPLANCRASTELGVPAWIGTMVRAMDKVTRIKSFIANGKLENESVEDSLKDLAAYALIALVLFREDAAADGPCRNSPTPAGDDLCDAIGPHHGDRCSGGRIQSPNAQFTRMCEVCCGTAKKLAAIPARRTKHSPAKPSADREDIAPTRRKRVYVAGPISKGDLGDNIAKACNLGIELIRLGFAPLVPQLTCYMGQRTRAFYSPTTGSVTKCGPDPEVLPCGTAHADWIGVDLPWVAVADAVLRLPGESAGADQEVAEACRLGIPVFATLGDLKEWASQ